MNVIFRSAGTIVVVGLVFGWSTLRSEQKLDKMVEHYQLTPEQTDFAQSCIASLNRHDKEFREGASHHAGCGCIASSLTNNQDTVAGVNYTQMSTVFGSVVKYSETDSDKDTDFAGLFQEMTQTQGLSYPDAISSTTEIGRVMSVCNSAKMTKNETRPTAVSVGGAPYQPAITGAPAGGNGCDGLSAASLETLQKIADRDGKPLAEVCASVIS